MRAPAESTRRRAGRFRRTSTSPRCRVDDFDAPAERRPDQRYRHHVPAEAGDAEEGQRAALHPARIAQARRARTRRRDRSHCRRWRRSSPTSPISAGPARCARRRARADVEAVFEFVVGDCELEIVELTERPRSGRWRRRRRPSFDDTIVAAAQPDAVAPAAEKSSRTRASASSAVQRAAEPERRKTRRRAARMARRDGRQAGGDHHPRRTREDRPRRQHGRRTGDRAGHARPDRSGSSGGRRAGGCRRCSTRSSITPASSRTASCRCARSRSARCSSACRGWCANSRPRPRKKVRLEMSGENTEVDRSIIERLGDPLTHIIRNSVDHGIESPADRAGGRQDARRARSASPPSIAAAGSSSRSRDDGAGINPERVLKKAREKGLVGPDATLTDDEINNLIFLPGFSTAETISDISGRGVGMDVVRRNIQDLGGRISLKSERGRGMTIQLALPLTLAVMDGMVIKVGRRDLRDADVGDRRMPAAARATISTIWSARAACCSCAASLVPIVHLGDLLDVASAVERSRRAASSSSPRPARARGSVCVVDELLRPPAGGDQEHRGKLRLGPGDRRRDHPRQWTRRLHPRCREALRAGG